MYNTLCQITTQYYENYSDSATPYWKPKGSFLFNLYVDSDDFFYSEEVAIETIKEMLANQSNRHEKFEYVSHELVFNEPLKLSTEEFDTIFQEKAKAFYNA